MPGENGGDQTTTETHLRIDGIEAAVISIEYLLAERGNQVRHLSALFTEHFLDSA